MGTYELFNYLHQALNVGDTIDSTGKAGVYALTNGKFSTKEVLRMELGRFLLYIASSNGVYKEEEVSLINAVIGEELNAYQLKELMSTVAVPNPSNSLSLMGFLSGDILLNHINGTRTSSSADALIQLFETFGNLMVTFDENAVSKARYAKYINGMKSYVMKNLK